MKVDLLKPCAECGHPMMYVFDETGEYYICMNPRCPNYKKKVEVK